ncbi:hypothetical protein AB0D04_34185 [Streptomyces sp. NPDC048483]|uniref:hypothetical protein n=1 Tax=Streptomyces sp. NPDC048483 TaxID=3154927 RepID=UPI003436BE35
MSDDGGRVLVAERVRQLLVEAAEPDVRVRCPGPEFTEQARRGLVRRRAALAAGVAAVVAVGAVAVPLAFGRTDGEADRMVPAASASCVRAAAKEYSWWLGRGFHPVSGTVRPGKIHLDDGISRGSGFRFEIDGTLAPGTLPSRGSVTIWNPVSAVQTPTPGSRYVLLMRSTGRPRTNGEPLYHFAPGPGRRIGNDGKVRLDCGRDGERSVSPRELRSAIADR